MKLKEHLDIGIAGDDISRLKEILDRAIAITKDTPKGRMCRVVRRCALVEGHLVVEFTVDSTNGERAQAAVKMFGAARELGVDTGSIEASDWREWLEHIGMMEVDGEARARRSNDTGTGPTDGS